MEFVGILWVIIAAAFAVGFLTCAKLVLVITYIIINRWKKKQKNM